MPRRCPPPLLVSPAMAPGGLQWPPGDSILKMMQMKKISEVLFKKWCKWKKGDWWLKNRDEWRPKNPYLWSYRVFSCGRCVPSCMARAGSTSVTNFPTRTSSVRFLRGTNFFSDGSIMIFMVLVWWKLDVFENFLHQICEFHNKTKNICSIFHHPF